MIRKEFSGIQWLEFELLADIPKIVHAVFLKKQKNENGENFNLDFANHSHHSSEKLSESLRLIEHVLKLKLSLVAANQIHGNKIVTVTQSNREEVPTCDALCTHQSHLGLLIKHGDCQAALFYDPIQRVIANVHCGWRGSVKNIYQHVIHHLQKTFNSAPEDLLVCIGPSLGPQSSQFIHFRQELPESFWSFQVKPHYFDFWEISRWQLQKCGILSSHIEIAEIDTYQNVENCFSYRLEKTAGRNATVIALR